VDWRCSATAERAFSGRGLGLGYMGFSFRSDLDLM
jgi:hypothetical protein